MASRNIFFYVMASIMNTEERHEKIYDKGSSYRMIKTVLYVVKDSVEEKE